MSTGLDPMWDFFIKQRNPLLLIIIIIVLGGIYAWPKLEISLFPEVTFPKIKVIADTGELPVDQMMLTVTIPLENAIKQVPDLVDIKSTTSRGSCELSAFMKWHSDIEAGLQRIESRINEVRGSLPPETDITAQRMNPSILPVIGYFLESNKRSDVELKELATYTIKPFLSQVEGVSEIQIIGGNSKEYWIMPDFDKLIGLGLTLDSVSAATSNSGFVKSSGYLTDYRRMYLTLMDTRIRDVSDIKRIVVARRGNWNVTIGDLAEVEIHESRELIKVDANGRQGVLVAVIKQPAANLLKVTYEISLRLNRLKALIPPDISFKPYYVQADFVRETIKSVVDALLIGLLLAIIVALLFLRSLRAGFNILISVALSICLTLVVLYAAGETINIMTLGAIAAAVGLIIDDAVVVVENFYYTNEENRNESPIGLVQKGLRKLFGAMLGSSLSTIVIFLPFLLMSGVAGAFFTVMTDTMIIILASSFLVTWLLLPVAFIFIARLNRGKVVHMPVVRNLEPVRLRLSWFLKRPVWSVAIAAFFIAAIIFIPSHLKSGFLPDMDEGSIVLDYISPPGTSLEETDRMLREVEKMLKTIPDIKAWSRRTGTQMGFFITEPNTGDYLIELKKHRTHATTQVIEIIRKKIEETQPALKVDFGQVISDMIGDLMSTAQPVEVKIFGNDRKQLTGLSRKVASIVNNIRGTADVSDGIVVAGPLISIFPNYKQLEMAGLAPESLQYQVRTYLEGNVLGSVFEENRLDTIRLIYPGKESPGVEGLKNAKILLTGGTFATLADLADVTLDSGEAEINRENLQTVGTVTARLNNRDLGGVMNDIRLKVASMIAAPPGFHIEYGGAYKMQRQSFNELLIILFLSCGLVFCVILFLYKEFKPAFIILPAAVLGIAGSFLALFLTGTPLNVGSYTGLIMIVGIVSENAIFTFLQFRAFRDQYQLDEAISRAVSIRLRPNLMTALGAIAALTPIALGIGTGTALHRPLAVAVIGGFLAALPILLIVIPGAIRVAYRQK